MPHSLDIALKNDSDLSSIHAYVTGIAIQQGKRCLLKANGKDLYFPQNSPSIGSPLKEDCAIPLGKPGNITHITIPQIAGGRIWIAEGKLTFLLNPGPALVEPSVLNPSDPNANVNFAFCEFTLNNDQLYANISYVDFVPRMPIAMSLERVSGEVEHVAGMAPDGLDRLAKDLEAQTEKDHQPWDRLIVRESGRNLRILNATHGNAVGADFSGYFDKHIDEAGPGVLEGQVNKKGELIIGGEAFQRPTTADVLGCNSGPFTTGASATRNAIIPRLAAAFVRSSLLEAEDQPSHPNTFYNVDPTNHYARLVHIHNLDGKGYSFAYDDVQPDDGDDQSGKVNARVSYSRDIGELYVDIKVDPKLFTVMVGGKCASAGVKSSPTSQQHNTARSPHRQHDEASAHQEDDGKPAEQGWRGKMHGLAKRILE